MAKNLSSKNSHLTAGSKLGRYEIRSQIGLGGMGEVYLALDSKLERSVALKILPKQVSADHGRMVRFTQWSGDGRAVMFVDAKSGVANIWSQPIDGSAPKQLTSFKSDLITSFAWSRDGKELVCSRGSVTSDVVLMTDIK